MTGSLLSIACSALPSEVSPDSASSGGSSTSNGSNSGASNSGASNSGASNSGASNSGTSNSGTGSGGDSGMNPETSAGATSSGSLDSGSDTSGDTEDESSSTGVEVCVSVGVSGGQMLTAPPDPALVLAVSTATTVEGWFYANAGTQGQLVGSRANGLPGWSARYIMGGTLRLELRAPGSDGTNIASMPLPEDQWHHFAFVRSDAFANGWMLYVDGQEATNTVNASMDALSQDVGTDYDIDVGAFPPHENQQFSGLLGPIALSNTDRYTAPFVPSAILVNDGDTIALWPFDEGSGTVVQDVAGDNDLTMEGATWERTGPACP